MEVALELLHLHGRACARVYHALAWVCVRAGRDPARRLRSYARLLGIEADEARALEAEARRDRAVRIGRDRTEKVWLHQALAELARLHPSLADVAEILTRRLRPGTWSDAAPTCPFEESQMGPPIVLPPRWSTVA